MLGESKVQHPITKFIASQKQKAYIVKAYNIYVMKQNKTKQNGKEATNIELIQWRPSRGRMGEGQNAE